MSTGTDEFGTTHDQTEFPMQKEIQLPLCGQCDCILVYADEIDRGYCNSCYDINP